MIHVEQQGPVVVIRLARAFLGRPLWWTAVYWVDGLLIDTGPRCTATQLARVLQAYPVEQIVLTHSHEPMIGGLAAVHQAFPQAPIYAATRALATIEQPSRLHLPLFRRLLWGQPDPFTSVLTLDAVDNVLQTHQFTFRVVETPGHTPDQITLFEPLQRWLFCSDAFIYGRDESWTAEADLFGVISSLRTLASLHPERLFSGNGRVSRTPLPELHEKIGDLIRLTREVARLDSAGLTVPQMVAQLFPNETRLAFWTWGHHSATHLVAACRSYNAIFAPLDQATEPGWANALDAKRSANPSSSSSSQTGDTEDFTY
jgi:glyoxylase-like metal-dependent hydrolase (beta-lactamase superfamily II)